MAYQLGIDLGTTFTAATVVRAAGTQPEVVTLGTRNATIPSVLFLGADGSVLVGEAAERRAVTDPDRVVREFKRRIGDPTPVVVGGRPWPAEELSARLVRWVIDRVAEREGGPAARVAVTHPAAWGRHKLDLLGRALAGQGLQVTFLPEPSAAAVAYAANQRVEPQSTIAVYDLGGGTFDAAVVRKAGSPDDSARFELLGRPEGIERLGGIDFDQAVFDHVRAGVPGAFDALDESDPEVLSAVARVRRECTDAKEALSADTETNIPVLLPGTRGSVRMHRSEFEARIGGWIEETVAALRRAVASAGLAPEALTAVLLVGGSSRIPLVSQMVSDQLGRPVAVDTDPKNAIAKGAALAVSPPPATAGVAAGSRPAGTAGLAGAGAGGAGRAGAAGAAGLAGAGAAAAGPPGRPPRVPLAGAASGDPARPPEAYSPPRGVAQHRSTIQEPPSEAYYADDEPRRRPPLALLIGVGALVALVLFVVALVASGSGDSAQTPTDVPATTEESTPTRSTTTSRNSGGGAATTTPAPAPDPVEPSTPTSPPTTPQTTTRTTPTTTAPTTAPSTSREPTDEVTPPR